MARKNMNWAQYDQALKQRGSITFWISEDVADAWNAEPTGKRGRRAIYSDLAIETALNLRIVFNQGLRQTEGLLESLFEMMHLELDVPDHTTLSRRNKTIKVSPKVASNNCKSINVIIDSTGLKIYGTGEWNETKHGLQKRRQWRKLHLAIDEQTLEIVSFSLTENSVGDVTEAPNMLDEIDNPVDEFIGDGAYDSSDIYDAVDNRKDQGEHKVTVPPKSNAVLSDNYEEKPTKRDEHVSFIKEHGRKAWEQMTQYYRRLLAENAMGRYKQIIGPKMRARDFEAQKVEAELACRILDKMISGGTTRRPALNLV